MLAMVIGAGLTGCLSALQLAEAGHSVKLYDQLENLGGVLRDEIIDGQAYFSGCQYLAAEGSAYALLRDRIDCDFVDFPHAYGSWTQVGDQSSYHEGVALPVLNIDVPPIVGGPPEYQTLAGRFDCYGQVVAPILKGFAGRWGHEPSELHGDCAQAMQMDRVMFDGADEEVRKRKSASTHADALLGLPRAQRFPDEPVEGAVLPREGFNALFRSLHATLARLGVDIRLKSPVSVRASDRPGQIEIVSRKERLHYDLVVWCCNPVSLLHAAGDGRLDSPATSMVHLHCQATRADFDGPFYIQCYDAGSSLYRIYSYAIGGRTSVTIEYFDSDLDTAKILVEAEQVLRASGRNCALSPVGSRHVTNHILFTPADHLAVTAFGQRAAGLRVVPGAWTTFGRDHKVSWIGSDMTALLDKLS